MFCPRCKAEYREGFSRCADCNVDLVPELSPEPEPSAEDVEYIDFIKIITFSSRHEAELAKGLLSINGINAVIFGDDAGGIQPGLSFSTGVQLLVKEEDIEKAERILHDAGHIT
jgi:hypothetical protein